MAKCFSAILTKNDSGGCMVEIPFDPKAEFGKVRAPVKVTVNGFTFRTTIAAMRGCNLIGINKANQAEAGIKPGDKITLAVELDTEPRVVTVPDDLAAALRKNKKLLAAWEKMSYSHKREYVQELEGAKRPETRAKRLAQTLAALKAKGE
jgi:hypothetical protein